MESTVIYGIVIFSNIYMESTVIYGINIFSNIPLQTQGGRF